MDAFGNWSEEHSNLGRRRILAVITWREECARMLPRKPISFKAMTEVCRKRDRMRMPAPDSFVLDGDPRDAHLTSDHGLRLLELRQVVGTTFRISQDQCRRCGATTCPSSPLDVIRCLWWHVPKNHGLQFTYIDAELKSRRAREHVDSARDELALDLRCLCGFPLGRMLLGGKWDCVKSAIDRAVVIGIVLHWWDFEFTQSPIAGSMRAEIANVVRAQASARGTLVPPALDARSNTELFVIYLIDITGKVVSLGSHVSLVKKKLPTTVQNLIWLFRF